MTSFNDYQSFTETTARYPDAGTGKLGAFLYVQLGMLGELGEAIEKHDKNAPRQDTVKELGDVFWYITRLHSELGVAMGTALSGSQSDVQSFRPEREEKALIISLSRLGEVLKKAMRDDKTKNDEPLTSDRWNLVYQSAQEILEAYLMYLNSMKISLQMVSVVNQDKLTSRVERDVINGDGDDR